MATAALPTQLFLHFSCCSLFFPASYSFPLLLKLLSHSCLGQCSPSRHLCRGCCPSSLQYQCGCGQNCIGRYVEGKEHLIPKTLRAVQPPLISTEFCPRVVLAFLTFLWLESETQSPLPLRPLKCKLLIYSVQNQLSCLMVSWLLNVMCFKDILTFSRYLAFCLGCTHREGRDAPRV